MRVIAGEARGRSLEALPGTDVTRPTLSQVKEAMFSIVQFDLPGARVLDLYAGSGQLQAFLRRSFRPRPAPRTRHPAECTRLLPHHAHGCAPSAPRA